MERCKKHSAIPLLVVAVIMIGTVFAKIYLSKEAGTFELRDLSGDRTALEDVTISGDLRDGYHRTHFSIRGSLVETNTEIYEKPPGGRSYRHSPGAPKIIDGIQYEARPSIFGRFDFDITYQDVRNDKKITSGLGYVKTGLIFSPEANKTQADANIDAKTTADTIVEEIVSIDSDIDPFANTNMTSGSGTSSVDSSNQHVFMNDLNYGITKIGDVVYFTVPTTSDYTGTNGIYEITDFSLGGFSRPKENAARELVTIDLENNRKGGGPKVEVLGLEAIGDKLVLILTEDNKLTLRGFDSRSGAELGKVIVDITIRDNGKSPADSKEETHSTAYEAFIDHDVQVINLLLSRGPVTPEEMKTTMLSFDLSDGIKWMDTVKESYPREKTDRFSDTTLISHRQGKLYVVKTLIENEEESRIPYDIARPKQLMIYVYKNAKQIYKGELVTDMNDDNNRVMNLPPSTAGFGYDEFDYRHFDNLKIE